MAAALRALGLRELPENENALRATFLAVIKRTHPDKGGTAAGAARAIRAKRVLSEAITRRDAPRVYVRFGIGRPQMARVVLNLGQSSARYLVTVKWFSGMSLKIGGTPWRVISAPGIFDFADVRICCV